MLNLYTYYYSLTEVLASHIQLKTLCARVEH